MTEAMMQEILSKAEKEEVLTEINDIIIKEGEKIASFFFAISLFDTLLHSSEKRRLNECERRCNMILDAYKVKEYEFYLAINTIHELEYQWENFNKFVVDIKDSRNSLKRALNDKTLNFIRLCESLSDTSKKQVEQLKEIRKKICLYELLN